MVRRHIVYVPGLGDGYDGIRRACLRLWKRPGVVVTLVPMRWRTNESYANKQQRLDAVLAQHPSAKITLVGESAGGAVVIDALRRHGSALDAVVTVCGMNYGAQNVSPYLYQKNPAFEDAMKSADRIVKKLPPHEKDALTTVYSSHDHTVRPRNTLIEGVRAYDLKVFGHMPAIMSVLLWRYRLFLSR